MRRAPLWRSESGAGSAEYAGAIIVCALLVAALIGAAGPLGGRISQGVICALESIFQGGSSCGGQPTAVPISGSPSGGAAGGGGGGGGGAAPAERPPVDQGKVDGSLQTIKDALAGGLFGVGHGELDRIRDTLSGLNGAEIDAVIAGLTDDELRTWVSEMEQGWWFSLGGWDRAKRQEMWTQLLKDASPETVRRIASFTQDIQPAFDDVGGDAASERHAQRERRYEQVEGEPVVDGVSPDDISQGQIGDCWYIASLMAVAQANPSVIEGAIQDNGNGTYTVRLYKDGSPVYVTVTSDQVVEGDQSQPSFARSTDSRELWPSIMEKALAAYEGSYGAIEGGWTRDGMSVLTGNKSSEMGGDYTAADMREKLDSGHAIGLGSKAKPDDSIRPEEYPDPLYRPGATDSRGNKLPDRLHYNHAYYVQSVDLGDPNDPSDDTVTIVNPWGVGYDPITLPFEDFKANFREVAVNRAG